MQQNDSPVEMHPFVVSPNSCCKKKKMQNRITQETIHKDQTRRKRSTHEVKAMRPWCETGDTNTHFCRTCLVSHY